MFSTEHCDYPQIARRTHPIAIQTSYASRLPGAGRAKRIYELDVAIQVSGDVVEHP